MSKISAKRKNGKPIAVDFDFGKDLDEMTEKFGENIVYNHAKGSLTVALQGFMRGQIDQEKTEKEVAAAVKIWKPGVRRQGKSPIDKMRDQLGKMSAEERAALLKEMRNTK